MYRQTGVQTDRCADRQVYRQTGVQTDRCTDRQVYRVPRRAAALQSELAVVLLAATLVLPDLLTALVVRQVQHLVSPTQLLHLQVTQVTWVKGHTGDTGNLTSDLFLVVCQDFKKMQTNRWRFWRCIFELS